MIKQYLGQKEKKVEYAELVYDLIFVYFIRRTNALLHHTTGGYVTAEAFILYIVCTLGAIQIWTFTTYYINTYGKNRARDYYLLFSNMFLMFFLGRGARADWHDYHAVYHIAWALILVNIAVQYLIERRRHGSDPHSGHINRTLVILFSEAALIGLAAVEFRLFSTTFLSVAAILFGMIAPLIADRKSAVRFVDFEHLSERAMLYVVLTFGEMIIATAGYFEGDITLRSLYFALLAFMIVVALFLSYGRYYDHIIDRKRETNGRGYMLIHLFLLFALNNITSSLEFMRDEEVDLIQKMTFMVLSLLLFFACLFATGRYAKQSCRLNRGFYLTAAASGAVFAVAMFLSCEISMLHIALTVIFVVGMYLLLFFNSKKQERDPS